MNITSFKDVSENIKNRFSECQLGKELEGKKFNCLISEYDKSLVKAYENVKNCPIEGGRWECERGNSKWIPNPDYVPQKSNPDGKTWSEILTFHGIDGIVFKDGEADFSKISKGNVEIENFSIKREDNFDKADIELAKKHGCNPKDVSDWRKANGYTWHECKDMKTMQKVPREIHNNVTHRGGISEAKKGTGENS
ncbi:HNH endonuclease [Clostridium sp.]|uniref:HNH endonuclease signature motif containing protein n=1 Tax=Clostridium sp. TaxID=1506 RepID=UPI00260B72AC